VATGARLLTGPGKSLAAQHVVQLQRETAVLVGDVCQQPGAAGALAGLAVGTIGLAAEWGWSHVWAVLPWPTALWPEAAVLGLVTAGLGIIGSL